MDSQYAPIPADTRAILRQKTLLGETYVELTPGRPNSAPTLPEGGTLPTAQVSDAVQLDEIFRTFNARTRQAFKVWMQGPPAALHGRGADLSAAIAELDPFAEQTNRVLRDPGRASSPPSGSWSAAAATSSRRSRSARASSAA